MPEGSWSHRNLGFGSLHEYTQQLKSTPQLLRKRAGLVEAAGGQQAQAQQEPCAEGKECSGTGAVKELNGFHLAMLGIGMMVGSGVFVAAGPAAHFYAGPAIILSFIVAGLSALFSTLCYSEFAAAKPSTAGAFSYLLGSLGEFVAFLMGATLVMAYVTIIAALARSFTPYFGLMMNQSTLDGVVWGTFQSGNVTVDVVAGVLVVALCLLVVSSTSGSSWFNIIVTSTQLLVLITLAVSSTTRMDTTAITPFMPFGWQGVLQGAAYVFFSFMGFDAVSTLSHEAREPARSVRRGMLGSVVTVTLINMVMSQCLILMVPYAELDPQSSWPFAFVYKHYLWGKFLAAFGACLGIISSLLVTTMGASQILAAIARKHMLLPFLAHTHSALQTPWLSTLALCAIATPLAMLVDVSSMVSLVSASGLVVFGVVGVALLWRRYWEPSEGLGGNAAPAGLIVALVLTAIANGAGFARTSSWVGIAGVGGAQLLLTAVLHFGCKQAHSPRTYGAPLFPYLPSASIFLNSLLAATLPGTVYVQYAIFLAAALVVYLLYSLQAQQNQEMQARKANGGLASSESTGACVGAA